MSQNNLTSFARHLRRNETVAEQALWVQLRDRKLDGFKFRRQTKLSGYIVDFFCAEAKLTIELDGIIHVGREAEDVARRRNLEAAGYLELRFSNQDIAERLHWVLHEIRRALALAKNEPIPEPLFQMEFLEKRHKS